MPNQMLQSTTYAPPKYEAPPKCDNQHYSDSIPQNFNLDPNLFVKTIFYAAGTQNYKCDGTSWVLDNNNADMWDNPRLHGESSAQHYFLATPDSNGGRPTWKSDDVLLVIALTLILRPSHAPQAL
jgi:hypothetical protein